MKTYLIQRDSFDGFLSALAKEFELYAPVKTDVIRFQRIDDPKSIDLSQNAFFPAKEFFFRKEETLFTFDGTGFTQPKAKAQNRVFFGLRKCDLNAIHHQDVVFIKDASDPYYTAQRHESFLLGYHCEEAPSKYCFCASLDLIEFHDLMFYDRKDSFLVEVGSQKGQSLVDRFPKLFQSTERRLSQAEKRIRGADRLQTTDIAKFYDHPDWKKGVDLCLSCTACTALCPTCYCFEVHDEVKTSDPASGKRIRTWSSCQVTDFTRVAGDHVFRKERSERFRHRIYHQLDYFKEKYGIDLCVGCGRCIEGCPTRIDFVEIINGMEHGKAK
ncbi:MAG: 4Fe-4S dicluster domain-containing protein [Nanoarchaeota archaeon]